MLLIDFGECVLIMSIYLIVSICLLSTCSCIGLFALILRKLFITIVPYKDEKQNFIRCLWVPFWISTAELIFAIASFILIICDCVVAEGMNDNSQIWVPCMLAGMVIGMVVGFLYWKRVKRPFFEENFPRQYKDYKKVVKTMWVKNRVRYHEEATTGNFIWPLFSIGSLIGIMLVYFL